MLFTSIAFLAFLAVVGGAYHLCPIGWRRWYLLAASYGFYCTWGVGFAFLLLAATGVAFAIAHRVARAQTDASKRTWLAVGIITLFVPLATFKYSIWLSDALAMALGPRRWMEPLAGVSQLAPLGLSYYTLKLVSYLIDVYWNRIEPCREFSAVATYAAFFPQIVSGPIQRAPDFIRQIDTITPTRPALVSSGMRLILFGLFKKLVLADRLGLFVDQVYTRPHDHPDPILALASYVFVLQLYADFSGLTDIAIGSGRILGITAPPNFDAPFSAHNIQEFWRRWHMTLTAWLGDYLFTPLRMALRDWGSAGLMVSLAVNMVAVGVWHGARSTYAVFGLMHGGFLIASTLTLRRRKRLLQRSPTLARLHGVTGPIVTFHLLVVSFVFFRAQSVTDGWYILRHAGAGLFQLAGNLGELAQVATLWTAHLRWSPRDVLIAGGAAWVMVAVHRLQRRAELARIIRATPGWFRWAGYYALALAILIWGQTDATQFIYANF
ncbi:MAG TPA: MBOAT family O-acyltransferase [Candidatus Binatia bacterium]|nr:MBOAT family O-acyltransferase [Candidatus Binatia bacterium]